MLAHHAILVYLSKDQHILQGLGKKRKKTIQNIFGREIIDQTLVLNRVEFDLLDFLFL